MASALLACPTLNSKLSFSLTTWRDLGSFARLHQPPTRTDVGRAVWLDQRRSRYPV